MRESGPLFQSRPSRTRPGMLASAVSGLREHLNGQQPDWPQLLRMAALLPAQLEDPDTAIPLESGFKAFEAAAELSGNPKIGVDYALATSVGVTGSLGFATVNATTVREALQTLARFMPLISSMRTCRYDEDHAAGSIVWKYPKFEGASYLQFMTWGITLVKLRIALALPQGWHPEAIELDIPRPRHHALYDTFFNLKIRYDCPINRFAVQSNLLSRPQQKADSRLYKLMTEFAEIQKKHRGVSGSVFEDEARAVIKHLLRDGTASATDFAAAIHLSPQQMRKTMKLHQLEFRQLLDDVRKTAARDYLLDTTLSVTEIAFELGYSDSSIFTRACTKWFKQSPRALRESALLN